MWAPEYWIARLAFERALAGIYLVAFLVALTQFRPLIGASGLMPVPRFVRAVRFRRSPSVFHLHYSDRFFAGVAAGGAALSAATALGLADQAPWWGSTAVWLLLWTAYLSIVNVGQTWYGFGWEYLLLEVGFLAAFLGPATTAVPTVVLWLLRWVLFRLEFGAGLIKLRGDRCWRDLTCLYYHHETQPMPGPLSWYFHHLPKPLHKVEVLANQVAQLVVPFGLFAPQPVAGGAALVIMLTQSWLVLSGNFSWLNVLTLTLTLVALDDATLHRVLPLSPPATLTEPEEAYRVSVLALAVVIGVLSYWPVRNLASRRQRMNRSFSPIHLVNTYGAFGTVTRIRHELVVEGTDAPEVTLESRWREYEFKGKPGDPRRRPPQRAPYHLRLDWMMWFAALSPGYADEWLVPFVRKLLRNDPATCRLLRSNPFADAPPAFVRVSLYRYRFSTWRERRETGAWWVRTRLRDYLRPMRLEATASSSGPPTGRSR